MGQLKVGVVGIPGNHSSTQLVKAFGNRIQYECLIDMEKISADLHFGQVFFNGIDLSSLDGLVVKKLGAQYTPDLLDRLEILSLLHHRGVPVFSNPDSLKNLLDRLSCTIRLRKHNIPMPLTTITEDVDLAVKAINVYEKAILKPLYTSKARGMIVLEKSNNLREKVEEYKQSGHQIIYIQKMVPIPGRDLGVVFLGGEYLATYSRVANKEAWNTTTVSGGKYEGYEPSNQVIELARKAQALFSLDFTCVDVVETPEGPLVFEVSAFGGFRGLEEAYGMDAAGLLADHIIKKINP